MVKKLSLRFLLLAVAVLAVTFSSSVAQADVTPEGQGITAAELASGHGLMAPPPGGWDISFQYFLFSR